MNSEVIFYQKVVERRVQLGEVGRQDFKLRAILYVNAAVSFQEALGIEGLPITKITTSASDEEIKTSVLELELFMDQLRAKHLFSLEPNLAHASVQLDKDWKSAATTMVAHIRDIVSKAVMDESLREPIMASLRQLQSEIDRNRTRMDAAADTWSRMTAAIGRGAENLEPAVKLVERLSKALGKAKGHEVETEEHPQLPPPDELLPPPDEPEDSA